MDADGGNLHEIASDPDACLNDANFTPDGARLVFTRFDFALEVEQIWSMKVDGSDRQFITDRGGPDANVSPDGRKISFKGQPDGALFVANIDGTGSSRSHRRSRSPTSTTGRPTAGTSSSATTPVQARPKRSTS